MKKGKILDKYGIREMKVGDSVLCEDRIIGNINQWIRVNGLSKKFRSRVDPLTGKYEHIRVK